MPSDYQSVGDRTPEGVSLDRIPPGPPERRKGRDNGGMGEFAGSPGLMALQGMEQIEKGMQLVAAGAPQASPLLQVMASMLNQLRQAIPQILVGGQSPVGPGMLTPPSMGMGGPPGIGAQGGAPMAPTPLPPGMGQ